jgi:hypothetical protein
MEGMVQGISLIDRDRVLVVLDNGEILIYNVVED